LISGNRWSQHLIVVGPLFMGIPMVFVKWAQSAKETPDQFSLLLLPRKLWTNSANSGGIESFDKEVFCFSLAYLTSSWISKGKYYARCWRPDLLCILPHRQRNFGFSTLQPLVISFKKQIISSPLRTRRDSTLPAWRKIFSIQFASPTRGAYLHLSFP